MKTTFLDSLSSNVSLFLALGLLCGAGILRAHGDAITNLPTLGGSFVTASALNDRGQVVGFSLTPGDAEQHGFLYRGGIIVDLQTLGGTFSLASGINSSGQIIGESTTAGDLESHGFLFDGTAQVDLGTLGGTVSTAVAINAAGVVAGHSTLAGDWEWRAFLYSNGVVTPIGTLGGSASFACAINGLGEVAGYSYTTNDRESHPFVFSSGTLTDLGTLGGPATPAALNDAGQVVGESVTTNGETHAFLYSAGAMIDLGTLGGTYSTAYAINQSGQVIGDASTTDDAEYRAFVYAGATMVDLGTLGGVDSSAFAINNRGQVVGESSDAAGRSAPFLWQNGVMVNLNSLLPADSQWVLHSAFFINDAGQIVGYGDYQGVFRWYLFTPGSPNRPPVAQAGADQSVECSDQVTLNGSASSDPDGDALTYEWRLDGAALGTTPTLALRLAPGNHSITLVVSDPSGVASEDSVVVSVVDTTPPGVACPGPLAVPPDANGQGTVPDFASVSGAGDACTVTEALVRTQAPAAGTVVAGGTHIITVTAIDGSGNTASCTTSFTVGDTIPPVIVTTPDPVTRSAQTNGQAVVPNLVRAIVATDNVTPTKNLVKTQVPLAGTLLGLGTHIVRVTVQDAAGNMASCEIAFTVVDTRRPLITSLSASPSVLAPASGALVPVSLTVLASDNCDPAPVCQIISVRSDEAVGKTAPDWEITGDLTLNLRAERNEKKDGRVYTIVVKCTDASGNSSRETVAVTVPSDPVQQPAKRAAK
jgi:probable HAF family extracellular repeat protein